MYEFKFEINGQVRQWTIGAKNSAEASRKMFELIVQQAGDSDWNLISKTHIA
jgi:hypothetical protein